MKMIAAAFYALISVSAQATTFLPTKIIDRMKNADGLIMGRYTGHSYKKIPTGDVVTEHIFTVKETAGIAPNDILNKHAFKVIVPGGRWNGLNYKVSGTPSFERGQDVVLMIKKGNFGYILPDLAFSKFSIKTKGRNKELVSDIFPNSDGVGKISFSDFNLAASEVFGHQLRRYEADKYVFQAEKEVGAKRSPASKGFDEEVEEHEGESHPWRYFWLILGLGSIGALGSWLNREMKD